MNPELEQLAQRAVGALVNGWYQGLLLTLVLWLGLKLVRGVNAATRHAVGFLVLLVVAVLPVFHFLMPNQTSQSTNDQASEAVPTMPVAVGAGEADARATAWKEDASVPYASVWDESFADLALAEKIFPPIEFEPETVSTPMPLELPEFSDVRATSREPGPRASLAAATTGGLTQPYETGYKLPSAYHWRAPVPGLASVLVLLLLGTVAGVRLLRLGWQWWLLLRLKHTAPPPEPGLTATFDILRDELKVTRPVRLLVDERINTPMAVGYFRSAVLLPAALTNEAGGPGLEAILRHELAHIRRLDDWCNLLQQVIAAVHFYNPAVAWLSRRLTLDREVACDDFALARSASRRDYALLLTEFAGRNRHREWIAAPAAWSNRSQLKERINMILDPNRNTSRRLARTSAGALTVAALATAAVALVAGPRLVLAASADTASSPPSASAAGVTLVSPSGDELIAHVDDAPSEGVTISTSADVDWNVEHDVSHAVAIGRGPGVVITARPTIKVVPGATIVAPGASGLIVAQAPPPEPAQPADVRPPKAPKPGRAPKALPAPAAAPAPEKSGESMEQRLERLERMIEQLVGGNRKFHFEVQPGKEMELKGFEWHNRVPPPGEPFAWTVPNPDQQWPMDEAQHKAMEESMKRAEKEMARTMKEAQREMARANQEVEKTRRDFELRAQLEVQKEFGHTTKDADLQRKALEDQRRSIEREMENLERQRERLEQQIERLDDQMERLEERAEESDEREEPGDETDAPPRVKEKTEKN